VGRALPAGRHASWTHTMPCLAHRPDGTQSVGRSSPCGPRFETQQRLRSAAESGSDSSGRVAAMVSDERFRDVLGNLGNAHLAVLSAFEVIGRRLHPPHLASLREGLAPLAARLDDCLREFRAEPAPEELDGLRSQLLGAANHAAAACALFLEPSDPAEAVPRVLGAMHEYCRALAASYSLRTVFPAIDAHFTEPEVRGTSFDPDEKPAARVGILNAKPGADGRGGFTLYVPETWASSDPRPLIVALHGGSGNGPDFLWTWLREARSRRCLLLAPTASGSTWSFNGPDVDGLAIISMIDFVRREWPFDEKRVLLTGLSDGATYTLMSGLGEESPFTALAPVSGVLHPMNFANGNLDRAKGCRIYLVHGALDWMFPVALAREAAEVLRDAGAELTYREIEDLSHTYPREENARILDWLLE
jgi:phospholipase/carboxylesterase